MNNITKLIKKFKYILTIAASNQSALGERQIRKGPLGDHMSSNGYLKKGISPIKKIEVYIACRNRHKR